MKQTYWLQSIATRTTIAIACLSCAHRVLGQNPFENATGADGHHLKLRTEAFQVQNIDGERATQLSEQTESRRDPTRPSEAIHARLKEHLAEPNTANEAPATDRTTDVDSITLRLRVMVLSDASHGAALIQRGDHMVWISLSKPVRVDDGSEGSFHALQAIELHGVYYHVEDFEPGSILLREPSTSKTVLIK